MAVRTAMAPLEADKLRTGSMLTDMTAEVHRVREWQAVFVRAQKYLWNPP